MYKIFCLLGKSSSGKDTIFKILKDDEDLKLRPIIPYTTRPRRSNEKDGVDYHFISVDQFMEFDRQGKIIERRSYNTVNGIWHYCTVDDGQIDLTRYNHLIIATLEAYKGIAGYFSDENVVPLYIEIDDGERLQRALNRERQQEHPNYDELCRRFLADNVDFSAEKLRQYGITKSYKNDSLTDCVNAIKSDIIRNTGIRIDP